MQLHVSSVSINAHRNGFTSSIYKHKTESQEWRILCSLTSVGSDYVCKQFSQRASCNFISGQMQNSSRFGETNLITVFGWIFHTSPWLHHKQLLWLTNLTYIPVPLQRSIFNPQFLYTSTESVSHKISTGVYTITDPGASAINSRSVIDFSCYYITAVIPSCNTPDKLRRRRTWIKSGLSAHKLLVSRIEAANYQWLCRRLSSHKSVSKPSICNDWLELLLVVYQFFRQWWLLCFIALLTLPCCKSQARDGAIK